MFVDTVLWMERAGVIEEGPILNMILHCLSAKPAEEAT